MALATNTATASLQRAESMIVEIEDYPAPGIVFRDVMPLLADHEAFVATVDALAEPFLGEFDAVAGIEARGFLLAGAIAARTGTGMLPVRKAGKLPRPAAKVEYGLEYGEAAIEAQKDLPEGARILVVDDVLATGGTVVASHELLTQLGYEVIGSSVLFEIDGLGGRDRLSAHRLHTVFHSSGEATAPNVGLDS